MTRLYSRFAGAALSVFLLLSQPALPQDGTPNRVRVSVNEVIVPVTVTDDKNRFVSNLDVNDFKIFDEGKEQKIEFFSRDRNQPVVVASVSNPLKRKLPRL